MMGGIAEQDHLLLGLELGARARFGVGHGLAGLFRTPASAVFTVRPRRFPLPTRGYIWSDLILTLRHAVCAQLSCSSDRSPSVALARGLWEPSPRGAGRPWLAPDSGATWKHISPLSASTRSRAICGLRSPRYPHKERLRRSRSLPCNATRVAIDHICAASASRCASPFRRCHRVRCLYTALGERGSPMRVTNQGHASRR